MNTNKLIITLAAIMLISFCLKPAANAEPVTLAIVGISTAVLAFGILFHNVTDKENAEQKKKAENAVTLNDGATEGIVTSKPANIVVK